ncbi:MAG: hypothetical protein DRH12_06215 [Deltaproteobacteria bacterium]|nr:MAG: hypothetical protein DRH12_06215 [Deltaproteobacteria bacterium]
MARRSLGGYRKGGYEKYKSTPEYREGLEKLENLGQEDTSVIVCAELLPWKCHRFQVAEDLVSRGWRVIHIIDRERTWEPSPKQRQQTFVFPKNNGAKTSV